MAPKCKTVKSAKFVLIWWVNSSYKDIIKTSSIPKSRRSIGDIIKLKWESTTGQSEKKDAKIIEFSDDEKFLENIRLNDKGEICGPDVRMFHEAIIQKKNYLGVQNKIKMKNSKAIHKNVETAIEMEPSIVNDLQIATASNVSKPFSSSSPLLAEIPEKQNQPLDLTRVANSTSNKETRNLHIDGNHTENDFMEVSDSEGEGDEENVKTSYETNSILYALIDQEVTDHDLQFFHSICRRLEKIAQNGKETDLTQIREYHLTPGPNKEEFLLNSGIFFPAAKLNDLKEKSKDKDGEISWRRIVKVVLDEIYGENLGNFSAQGKRQKNHSAIDKKLFKALYECSQQAANGTITTLDFISEINKITCNKRKCTSNRNSPTEVTAEGICFFKKVFEALKKNKNWNEQSDLGLQCEVPELPEIFTRDGHGKMKIANNSTIVLPKSVAAYIERKAESPSGEINWKELVRNVLIEIYKDDMRLYSATGKRSNYPAIHSELYNGLYGWITSKNTTEPISIKAFNRVINKLAGSKRETFKLKQSNLSKKGPIDEHTELNSSKSSKEVVQKENSQENVENEESPKSTPLESAVEKTNLKEPEHVDLDNNYSNYNSLHLVNHDTNYNYNTNQTSQTMPSINNRPESGYINYSNYNNYNSYNIDYSFNYNDSISNNYNKAHDEQIYHNL